MNRQYHAGDAFPPLGTANIHGETIQIPARDDRITHLQFRRFAGCPVCNLHLQGFITRHRELRDAGIREIVIYHSSASELLPYQGRFPFDVIGDPDHQLYHQYGVQKSARAILDPRAWPAAIRGNLRRDKPAMGKGIPNGGLTGLPADFLIAPDGRIIASHYGQHADDQWDVDTVLRLGKQMA